MYNACEASSHDSSSSDCDSTDSSEDSGQVIQSVVNTAELEEDASDISPNSDDCDENPTAFSNSHFDDSGSTLQPQITNQESRSTQGHDDDSDEVNPEPPHRKRYRNRLDLELDDWLDPSLPRLYHLQNRDNGPNPNESSD